ncbi:enoyl-CoA hydratase [Salsuginibacillus kocurii]|uniref:enoyl-CoA hydratase n=1 Tax=Salsuginibacillus kocurii TaxID=427078 RepID=UPI0003726265|nr:enoyl-CoA hydratase [Salsuginibacillus kocurii]
MDALRVTEEDYIAYITIVRPPANALSTHVLKELEEALQKIEHNPKLKAVIISGEGRFFAAGADIKEFTNAPSGKEFSSLAREGQELFTKMQTFPKPIIAAIHGAALGGGLELAMACHMRLASEGTKLGLPELTLGIIPGFAGTQRLPRLVGSAKAAEMLLTAEPIGAEEAERWGLINRVCSEGELLEEAKKLAEKIANKSAVSTRMIIELLTYSTDESFEEGMMKESELFGQVYDSYDGQEGIRAFLEKRSPVFKDK